MKTVFQIVAINSEFLDPLIISKWKFEPGKILPGLPLPGNPNPGPVEVCVCAGAASGDGVI